MRTKLCLKQLFVTLWIFVATIYVLLVTVKLTVLCTLGALLCTSAAHQLIQLGRLSFIAGTYYVT